MQVELTAGADAIDLGLYEARSRGQVVVIFVKRTYDIVPGRRMRRSSGPQVPLFPEPIEEDADGTALVPCLRHECDLAPFKPCTDVVVHGHVRSPGAAPVSSLHMSVRVGGLLKRVLAVGDRLLHLTRHRRLELAAPEPFVEIPLTWRRAYGAIDATVPAPRPRDLADLFRVLSPEEHPGAYPRNPAGTGWLATSDLAWADGLALPNFEDPAHLLSPGTLAVGAADWSRAPQPAGFGWISQTWFPRSSFLGIGPEIPPRLRRGWLADAPDLRHGPDSRFFSGAPPGLRALGLRGDEVVELEGFRHEGRIVSALPDDRPQILMIFDRHPSTVVPRLHTIELYPDREQATLLWTAELATPYPLPRRLPIGDDTALDVLEGINVIIDGVAIRAS